MKIFCCCLFILLFACQPDPAPEQTAAQQDELPPLSSDYEDADYKWGFANAAGRLVVPASYDEVRPFGPEGLALVRKKGEWNFIEANGKQVSRAWALAWPYAEGLARVKAANDSIGFINVQGAMAIAPTYSDAGDFSGGFAWVKREDLFGLIDQTGKQILPFAYEKLTPVGNGSYLFRQNRKEGLIEVTGKIILPANYKKLKPFTSNGLAAARADELYGYLNRTGTWQLPPAYLQAGDFAYDRAVVMTEDEKWQLIDATGKNYLRETYAQLWYANENRWIVEKEGRYGAIDAEGNTVIPLIFAEIQAATEGFMAYQQEQLWGFLLASDGTPLTPPAYGLVWPFKNGFARVATKRGLSLIDTLGQLRLPPLYLDLRDGSNGLFPVQAIK